MIKVLIVFATLTGNTETVATHLYESFINDQSSNLKDHIELEIKDLFDVETGEFSDYDLVVFGTSTWGEGEMNPVAEEFFMDIDSIKFKKGTKFALFGLGESHYEIFCSAVHETAKIFRELKANIVGEIYEIDGYPDDEILESTYKWFIDILIEVSK